MKKKIYIYKEKKAELSNNPIQADKLADIIIINLPIKISIWIFLYIKRVFIYC